VKNEYTEKNGHAPSRWIENTKSRTRLTYNRILGRALTIQSGYGGLGDHLILSHLPRVAKESGKYDRVLVSNRSLFRDPACRVLVWESNPHVDGFTDEQGLVLLPPHTQPTPEQWRSVLFHLFFQMGLENRITHLQQGCNLLDQFMLSMGLDDGLRFHEPEIHIEIPIIQKYQDLVIYDPNYITNVGSVEVRQIERFFEQAGIKVQAQMALRNKSLPLSQSMTTIKTESLMDFCSVIVSCKELYCLTTGTATLAAALKKPCTVLYGDGVNPLYHHSRLHRYIKL
jgi:hypothetical protein